MSVQPFEILCLIFGLSGPFSSLFYEFSSNNRKQVGLQLIASPLGLATTFLNVVYGTPNTSVCEYVSNRIRTTLKIPLHDNVLYVDINGLKNFSVVL